MHPTKTMLSELEIIQSSLSETLAQHISNKPKSISHLSNLSLSSLTSQFHKVAQNLKTTSDLISRFSIEKSQTLQALSASLFDLIRDLKLDISLLEHLYSRNSKSYLDSTCASLLSCVHSMLKINAKIEFIMNLSKDIDSCLDADDSTSKVLDLMFSRLCFLYTSNSTHYSTCYQLYINCLSPYFEIMNEFITTGILKDKYKEFFIKDAGVVGYNQFELVNVPEHFYFAKTVLGLGKSSRIFNSHNVSFLLANFNDKFKLGSFEYENSSNSTLISLDEFHSFSFSRTEFMSSAISIDEPFQIIKFIDSELHLLKTHTSQKFIGLILESLDKINDIYFLHGTEIKDFFIELFSRVDVLHENLNINEKTVIFKSIFSNDAELICTESALNVKISIHYPCSIIITPDSLKKYNKILNFLFNISRARLYLDRICVSKNTNKTCRLRISLCLIMRHFYYNLESQIILVVTSGLKDLKTKINEADFDEIIKLHEAFLDECMIGCLMVFLF